MLKNLFFSFFIIICTTLTMNLCGNESQLSLQNILAKLKNKELNVGDTISHNKTEYRIAEFDEEIDKDKKICITLQKSITIFGIKIADDYLTFSIYENAQNPTKSTINFTEYRTFNKTYDEVKEIGTFATITGFAVTFFGTLLYIGAKGNRKHNADFKKYGSWV